MDAGDHNGTVVHVYGYEGSPCVQKHDLSERDRDIHVQCCTDESLPLEEF